LRKFVKKIWMDEIEVIDNWSEARKGKKVPCAIQDDTGVLGRHTDFFSFSVLQEEFER